MENTKNTTGEPMRCRRRAPGEIEAAWPMSTHHECACCGDILPNGVITHHDDDHGGYVCHECGPALQMAELELLSPPVELRNEGSPIRRPEPEEIEALMAWDR